MVVNAGARWGIKLSMNDIHVAVRRTKDQMSVGRDCKRKRAPTVKKGTAMVKRTLGK